MLCRATRQQSAQDRTEKEIRQVRQVLERQSPLPGIRGCPRSANSKSQTLNSKSAGEDSCRDGVSPNLLFSPKSGEGVETESNSPSFLNDGRHDMHRQGDDTMTGITSYGAYFLCTALAA